MAVELLGYNNCILRINLNGSISTEPLDREHLRCCIGGTGLGAKYLYDEIPPDVQWNSKHNKLLFMTGPITGTRVPGTSNFSILTKGPMTNLAVSSQANGFFGAYLKKNNIDGIIIEDIAPKLCYIYIDGEHVEIKDALHLKGLDTWETEKKIKDELRNNKVSVFAIGPAGENLVRFAAIVGDNGHVAAHNGLGAVMGSKNLKAIVVRAGNKEVSIKNTEKLKIAAIQMAQMAKKAQGGYLAKYGTGGAIGPNYKAGQLAIKNYTTNIWPAYNKFTGEALRIHFKHKTKLCWMCGMHGKWLTVTEGPYKGFTGEEPEAEGIAACGSLIGNEDPGSMVYLANFIDRQGLDINETGWVLSFVMESYEEGLLNKQDLGGIEMNWGNIQGAIQLINTIVHRQGIGDILAEGVKRASTKLGESFVGRGIYTLKGATPRSHDHRGRWDELLDTCLSNTSTIEASGGIVTIPEIGVEAPQDKFSPIEVAKWNADKNGRRQFEDSVSICRLCSPDFTLLVECLNNVTGWDMTVKEAMEVGRRTVNRLRVFNFRHGLDPMTEMPSSRYCSAPVDGPAKGTNIGKVFKEMRRIYWKRMGWDEINGKPLPETLEKYGLDKLISDLWP